MFFIHNSFVLEKMLEKEQKKIKPYTTKWLYINGRGRRTWSRLPARSVLLHFVQRSPPETRTPQHAPRASESKSFYSMPKQKRSPFGNRFRFGRACAVKSELKPDFSRSSKVIVFVPFL